jgi:hypothetical protein
MTEKTSPAYPCHAEHNIDGDIIDSDHGLTAVELVALKTMIPESGTKWIDAMIRKGLRVKLAMDAMTADIQNGYGINSARRVGIDAASWLESILHELDK